MTSPGGPDFKSGIPARDVPDGGMVLGHVDDEAVLLARAGDEFFAVGAHCTHYHGPLAEGLVVGDTVRCPWHHACFSLRTGEALRAPALDPIACWRVERDGDTRRSCARSCAAAAPRRRRATGQRRRRSSSSAAAPPGSRPPTCCAAKATTARSR